MSEWSGLGVAVRRGIHKLRRNEVQRHNRILKFVGAPNGSKTTPELVRLAAENLEPSYLVCDQSSAKEALSLAMIRDRLCAEVWNSVLPDLVVDSRGRLAGTAIYKRTRRCDPK